MYDVKLIKNVVIITYLKQNIIKPLQRLAPSQSIDTDKLKNYAQPIVNALKLLISC